MEQNYDLAELKDKCISKNPLAFYGKICIFYTENKQTGQQISSVFGQSDQKTKNGMNQTFMEDPGV